MAPRKCGSCDRSFLKNDSTITCDGCKRRYHENCTALSDNERQVLSASSHLKWFCILCRDDVGSILDNYEKFQKVSDAIEKMKDESETRFADIEKRLTLCEAETKKCDVKKTVIDEVKKSTEKDYEEATLIKSKENNIIYFGFPETNDDSAEDRMKHDFKLLTEAYKKNIENSEITSMFRVGKKTEEANRPLVIKYASVEMKKVYLKSSGNLEIKHRNEVKKVFASIDRTEKQREKHRKIVGELNKRKDDGEVNLVIRDKKIVTNFPKESGAQKITWASLFRS